MVDKERLEAYWKKNLALIRNILIIWFIFGYVLAIIFVEPLNNIKLGGTPLGFWFAHQGSIYVFVALIFIYAKLIGKIDKEYDVEED